MYIPKKVKNIINKYDYYSNIDNYKQLKKIKKELFKIGWFMDYGLDAEITELKPILN